MATRIRKYEQDILSFGDGKKTFANLLIDILRDIDARVAIAEDISSSVTGLQDTLLSYGREMIDETVAQVVDEVSVAADLGMVFTGRSVTPVEIGAGTRDFVINEDQRLAFAPAAMLVLVDADNPTNVMWGRKLSYSRDTGALSVNVLSFQGAGEVSSWIITAGSIADMAGKVSISPVGFMTSLNLQGALGEIAEAFEALGDEVWTKAEADGRFLALAGGTMAGAVVLPAASPTHDNHATRKKYVDDLVSSVENGLSDEINSKAPSANPTFTGTVVLPSGTSIGNVSSTEISYVDGVTSAIQTQLNTKAPIANPTFTGTVTAPKLALTDIAAVSLVSTTHAFQIGPTASANLAMSPGDIQARSNGSATQLRINYFGGALQIGSAGQSALFYSSIAANAAVFSAGSGWDPAPNFATNTLGGWGLYAAGSIYAAREGTTALLLQRLTNIGTIVQFYQGNSNVGSISVSASATTYNTSSDERLKEDFQPIDSDIIDQIAVYDFAWKVDGSRAYGVKAQELDPIIPQAVFKGDNPDDMWAVDYSKLVPILIAAVQDLRARVVELEAVATAP